MPCFDSCQFTTTYMCNIRLQAPILSRESDNLHCFPGRTDGQTYGQVTTKILAVDKQPNFLSYGAPLAIALRKNKKADYNPHKIRLTR